VSGVVTGIRPRVQAILSIKGLEITTKPIWFTLDTGSTFCTLAESDATLNGIDCSMLPLAKRESIGFGGLFKPRMIDRQCELIFNTDGGEYKVGRSGLVVVCPPDEVEPKVREQMLRLTPSVIGMDVLNRFDIHIYKKRVQLDLREP